VSHRRKYPTQKKKLFVQDLTTKKGEMRKKSRNKMVFTTNKLIQETKPRGKERAEEEKFFGVTEGKKVERSV